MKRYDLVEMFIATQCFFAVIGAFFDVISAKEAILVLCFAVFFMITVRAFRLSFRRRVLKHLQTFLNSSRAILY